MVRFKKLWSLVALLIALVSLQNLRAQEAKNDEALTSLIQKQGERFVKNKDINAVSIGVYFKGKTYTDHFGEIDKNQGNTPDDSTLYEIGSVSKTVTGYLVAKAVVEGKIKLEDDIRNYLEGNYPNLAFNGSPISMKHLLTHTSGLPMFLPLAMNGLYETLANDVPEKYLALEKSYDKTKFLADLNTIALSREPGTQYAYSNAGAELAGYILEQVNGSTIEDMIKEYFTQEYGALADAIKTNTSREPIKGYWLSNKIHASNQLNPLWSTAGGMRMSMTDMMKYAAINLQTQNPIIKESQTVLYQKDNSSKLAYYWQVQEDKYGKSFNHHGGTSGFQNWLFIFPKYDLAISIITNQSGSKTPKLLAKAAKNMLKAILKD